MKKQKDRVSDFLTQIDKPRDIVNELHKHKLKQLLYKEMEKTEKKSFFETHPAFKTSFTFAAAACACIIAVFSVITVFNSNNSNFNLAKTNIPAITIPEENQGIISLLNGEGKILREEEWIAVQAGDIIKSNDFIQIDNNSYCEMIFNEKVLLSMNRNTTIKINNLIINPNETSINVALDSGEIMSKVNNISRKDKIYFESNEIQCNIAGTVFMLRSYSKDSRQNKPEENLLAVYEGKINVIIKSSKKEIAIINNQELIISFGAVNTLDTNITEKVVVISEDNKLALAKISKLNIPNTKGMVRVEIIPVPSNAIVQLDTNQIMYGKVGLLVYPDENYSISIQDPAFKEASLNIKPDNDIKYEISLTERITEKKQETPDESDSTQDSTDITSDETNTQDETITDNSVNQIIPKESIIEETDNSTDYAISIEDKISPVIDKTEPWNRTTNVIRIKVITIVFNEEMQKGKSILIRGSDIDPVSATWTDNKTLEIVYPKIMNANTNYTIILNPKGYNFNFKDLSGNILSPDTTISFRTGFQTE